jgi:hypothetical protein
MSKRRMHIWLRAAILLLAGSSPALAIGAELQPFTASYGITRGKTQVGSAELQLQQLTDGRWSYQQRTLITNFLARIILPSDLTTRSLFSMKDGRLIPEQFTADAGGSDEDQSLTFDWSRGRVTGTFDRKPVDLPLQPGLLDNLSVQIALMNELLAGRTPQRFVLADKGRIKDYNYKAEGSETLHTAVGEHRTVIFRSSRPGSDKSTLFWCAPELGYLPLKVERRDGKDVQFALLVKSVSTGDR